MNNFYMMAGINDVHFGVNNEPERTLYEFNNEFISFLTKMPLLDVVFIRGDFFEKKYSLQSQTAICASQAMWQLIQTCKMHSTVDKKVKIRVIRGTYFHDNDQLEIFRCYEHNTDVDFKIINSVCSEYLFPNLRVLYIPEEYIMNKDEYYKNYFNDQYYDLIVGHGLIEETRFVKQSGEMTIRQAPVFTFNELNDICAGPITFGHIHNGMCIRNHFYYTGSFSASSFGDSQLKGFDIMGYYPEDSKYFIQFIPNRLSRRYEIIDFSDFWIGGEIEQTIKNIENFYIDIEAYKLRVDVTLNPANEVYVEIMKQYFKNNKNIQVKINNNTIYESSTELESVEEKISHKKYLRDKNLLLEDKIQLYIKQKKDIDIPIDTIRNILYD